MKKQKQQQKGVITEEIIFVHSSKIVRHALNHKCEVVDHNNEKIIHLKSPKSKYFIRANDSYRLEQAQHACLQLGIPLMSKADWT